jgi:O-antigen ligase
MNQKNPKLENALLYLIYTGFFIIVTTPLLYTNSLYYPYVTLKNFVFRFTIEAMSVIWFILIAKNNKYFPKFQPLHLCLMIFLAILAFANVLGVDPGFSMWGNLERMDGLITIVHLFIYMLIASSVITSKRHWFIFANLSLLIASIVGGIGLSELGENSKVLIYSTLGNSSYLAIYTLFHLFLAGLLYLYNKEKKYSSLYIVFLIFFSLIIYNTGSRGSLIALLAGAVTTLAIYDKKHFRKFLLYGSLVFMASGALLWSFKSSPFVQSSQTLKRIVDIDGSTSTRMKIWRVSAQAIKERPFTGWGQENFTYVLDRYYDSSLGDAEPWFDRAHNVLFDWTIAAGFPGLIVYLAIFFTAFVCLWKTRTKIQFSLAEKAIISGVLVAYFVNNLFIFDSVISYIFFFTILSFISAHESEESSASLSKIRKTGILAITFCLVIFMSYCLYFVNLPALKSARGMIHAITYAQEGLKQKAIDLIEEISMIESFAKRESYEQLAQISPSLKTLEVLKKSAHTNPLSLKKSYIYLTTAAKIKSPEIEEIFLETTALSPTRQIIYLEMIFYYLRANNFAKAFEFSKYNYDINPEVNRSKSMYALCAVLNNNIKLSEELIAKMPIEEYVQNKMFIEAYKTVQRIDKIIEFYQKSIMINPKDPENHLKLGMLYSEMGKSAEAAREFEISKELTQKKLSE